MHIWIIKFKKKEYWKKKSLKNKYYIHCFICVMKVKTFFTICQALCISYIPTHLILTVALTVRNDYPILPWQHWNSKRLMRPRSLEVIKQWFIRKPVLEGQIYYPSKIMSILGKSGEARVHLTLAKVCQDSIATMYQYK
jgi:hypothetical protein